MRIAFHIGLHKTATTWLQSVYFDKHPEIKVINNYTNPWNDELIRYLVLEDSHSFCKNTFIEMVKKRVLRRDLVGHKGLYLISAERLSGHPLSGGFDREKIALNIDKAFPESKKIIFIRNQIDQIESTYQQLVREGYLGTLTQMINEDCWKIPCFKKEYFNYQNMIKRYKKIFGNSNFEYFLFEYFLLNQKKMLESMCDYLDISTFEIQDGEKVNKRSSSKETRAMRILNHARRTDYNNYPVINIESKSLYNVLYKFTRIFYSGRSISLTSQEKSNIFQYYLEGNKQLFNKEIDRSILIKYINP